ncbi:Conserved oligomeric Golgi complex subunit 3 (COG3) [Paratrimastix pyriformis]|uniref:Conserved oligomeric Golgi complex subunit 3 (COG3) n=1 Tax=Paratrimastix pyriformis TaxID=342808 RepID=A0ABQ8UBF4_9EUKA|nr:Conserved oligomeric Golgi complex subunit 3 (COG3) [Paratrimastix pyriformis]
MHLIHCHIVFLVAPHPPNPSSSPQGPIDAQLFLVMHLILLREELRPFEAPFSVSEVSLDFSPLTDMWNQVKQDRTRLFALRNTSPHVPHITLILTAIPCCVAAALRQRAIRTCRYQSSPIASPFPLPHSFSLSNASNALFALVSQATPRVMVTAHDSRQQLEKELRFFCRSLIACATRYTLEPLAPWLGKFDSAQIHSAFTPPTASPQRPAGPTPTGGLRLNPAQLASLARELPLLRPQLAARLREIEEKMRLYLSGVHSMEEILLNPVKENVETRLKELDGLLERAALPAPVAAPGPPPPSQPAPPAADSGVPPQQQQQQPEQQSISAPPPPPQAAPPSLGVADGNV